VLAGFFPSISDWGQTVVPTATTVVTKEVDLAGQSTTVLAHRVTVKIWVEEMVEVTSWSPGMLELSELLAVPVLVGARVNSGSDEVEDSPVYPAGEEEDEDDDDVAEAEVEPAP
jgi:hypothetical protein